MRGTRLSLVLSAATAVLHAQTAQAQYYVPSRVPPSIELNLDVLEEAPATTAPQAVEADILPTAVPATPQPAPEPIVDERSPPLVQPFFTAEPEQEEPPLQEEIPQAPSAKRPFFTAQTPDDEEAATSVQRPRPKIAKAPRPKQAVRPVEPQPQPMVTQKVERLPPVAETQDLTAPILPTAVSEPLPEAAPMTETAPASGSFSTPDATLAFSGQESAIGPVQEKALSSILMRLTADESARLQLRAYAAGDAGGKLAARRISLSRALAVRTYLMEKGIRPSRIDVRAMGAETETGPADRVDMIFTR